MGTAQVIDLARQTLALAVIVSAPLLLLATFASVLISLVQVLTSMQDMTSATVVRLLVTAGASMVMLPWMLRHLVHFSVALFGDLTRFAH